MIYYKKTQIQREKLTRKSIPRKCTSTLRGNVKSSLFPRKAGVISRGFNDELLFPRKFDVNIACNLRENILHLLSEEILNPLNNTFFLTKFRRKFVGKLQLPDSKISYKYGHLNIILNTPTRKKKRERKKNVGLREYF